MSSRCFVNSLVCSLQVHEKIRENPVPTKKERVAPAQKGTNWPGKPKALTYDERKEALKARLTQLMEEDE